MKSSQNEEKRAEVIEEEVTEDNLIALCQNIWKEYIGGILILG